MAKTASEVAAALGPHGRAREMAMWADAHRVRVDAVGPCVHLRAIVEFSNYCRQDCLYCGLRRSNAKIARCRMDPDEIVQAAVAAWRVHKFGTFVLQSGEDPGYPPHGLARAIRGIKASTNAAVTLSVGEAPDRCYRLWREAGADRFLLKFETSDPDLFAALKPTTMLAARMNRLRRLREMGYQVGSGIILGLPGQDRMSVARDLILCGAEDYEMVSIGPFVPHPDTPLGQPARDRGQMQAAATVLPPARTPDARSTLNTIAVARLLAPMAHIPATTALGVVGRQDEGWRGQAARYLAQMGAICGDSEYFGDARYLALLAGANVLMLDVTPWKYRSSYEIYPGKPGADGDELADSVSSAIREISRLGMSVCPGTGDSPKAPWGAGRGIQKEDTQKGECSDDARPS
jgi:biotin synthase